MEKIALRDLHLLFYGKLFFNISKMIRASAKMSGRQSPPNGVIAKIVFGDLDLLFEGQTF